MATFDVTDPKVITVKKGQTTQVLLFLDALKNSSNSAEWRDHEVRFAKIIAALSLTTLKFEELKAKGRDYQPSVYELGSLYQDYSKSVEGVKTECEKYIHLLKDKYQSERCKVMQTSDYQSGKTLQRLCGFIPSPIFLPRNSTPNRG